MSFIRRLHDVVTGWELLLLASIVYILLDVPLEAAFHHKPTSHELLFDALIASLFFIDAVVQRRNLLGIKSPLISRFLRFLMATPCEVILYLGFNESEGWVVYVQLLRLLLLPGLISTIRERGKTHIIPNSFKLITAASVTIVVLNFLACGWLVIYPPEEDYLTEYNKALYWLITTIATVGYGDITPSTNLGRIYTMMVMIIGAAIWGILIASASRMMLASDLRKQQKKEKLDALQSFLNHYDVPKNLRQEIIGFLNHQWSRKISEDEEAILNDLPPSLQRELQALLNIKPISRVSLFRGTSNECLSDVAGRLNQVFFSPGEKIISKGDDGEDMYLIGHGVVTVHVAEEFITSLGPGSCFGEMALMGDAKRTTDVTAASYCDLFKLNKAQLEDLISRHPDLRTNVLRLTQERLEKSKRDKNQVNPSHKAS